MGKGEATSTFSNRIKVLGYPRQSKDANHIWKAMADTIRQAAKEILGVSTSKQKVYKESWWRNEEVRKKINDKNIRFKELMACTEEGDRISKREIYHEAKRVAKKAVAEAKSLAYEDFYKKLDTKDEEKHSFKLAKVRSRRKQDIETIRYIKGEDGKLLLRQVDIKNKVVPVLLSIAK